MTPDSRIYVAGHTGLVGSAIVRKLEAAGYSRLILRPSAVLDLRDQGSVNRFFARERPEYVFLAAARVGGILANSERPADFLRDNLLIEANVIEAAHASGATKLLFLGSSCIYPRLAPQPIKEEYLLTGVLEPTNQPYAIAKIAGLELVSAYRRQHGFPAIALMPTNLYGPHDNFRPTTSHVLPALIRRFHEVTLASVPAVAIWGSGTPRREFLYVDDLADACLFVMQHYDGDIPLNVGTGEDITIRELAEMVADVVGYRGAIGYDPSKPDGTPRKLLDVSRLTALGWMATVPLRRGIEETYAWYRAATAS